MCQIIIVIKWSMVPLGHLHTYSAQSIRVASVSDVLIVRQNFLFSLYGVDIYYYKSFVK